MGRLLIGPGASICREVLNLKNLFRTRPEREALAPLYAATVAEARDPAWYLEGGVPDTIDGRFDMVAAVTALALDRLGTANAEQGVWLTELFVDDMDGQLRELGVGDVVVGKHIGKMMSALGGRLGAYRDVEGAALAAALTRNLYRGAAPEAGALAFATARFEALRATIAAAPLDALLAGTLR